MILDTEFYYTVCFIIFCVLIYKHIKNFVLDLLDTRIDSVKNMMNETEILYKESCDNLEKAQSRLDDSIKSANDLLESSRTNAEYKITQMKSHFEKECILIQKNSDLFIENIKSRMISKAKNFIAEEVYNRTIEKLSLPPKKK